MAGTDALALAIKQVIMANGYFASDWWRWHDEDASRLTIYVKTVTISQFVLTPTELVMTDRRSGLQWDRRFDKVAPMKVNVNDPELLNKITSWLGSLGVCARS